MEWWKIEQSLSIFIEQYIEEMNEIPYLEQFYGTMENLIISMKVTESYFNKFRLAGTLTLMIDQYESLRREMNNTMFKDLVNYLDENNIEYPAIYESYKRK